MINPNEYPYYEEFYQSCKKMLGETPFVSTYFTEERNRKYSTSKGNINVSAIESAKGWVWTYKDEPSGVIGTGYSLEEAILEFDIRSLVTKE